MYGYYNDSEWEKEVSVNVNCGNEECAEFDKDQDADILYSFSGMYGVGEWTCATCQTTQTDEREFADDYFVDPDAGRDDY